MKYGVLGDIHSNLTALRAVLERCRSHRVDRLLSVGDVVGYGAAPSECIELLRESAVRVVKGNHDAACIHEMDLGYFNTYARAAVLWTRAQLSREESAWLARLPLTLDLEDCSVAHGTYHRPERFDYVQGESDADASLDRMPTQVCFVGHSHVPISLVRLEDDPLRTARAEGSDVDLSDVRRALINVGSVGQPRDDDPRAAYAIFDSEEQRVVIERVRYDIDIEARRIRAAGLPPVLADRLFHGV